MVVTIVLCPWLILVVAYGACIGSFLNVVILRLPAGESLWRSPSHCPRCETHLAWFDNIPILGWLLLRGRCRYCRAPINAQYPLVEAAAAALFGATYASYYMLGLNRPFEDAGLSQTWPVLIVHLVLVGALLAATIIDARLYIIPLDIPNFVAVTAMIVFPLAVVWVPGAASVMPRVSDWAMVAAVAGGVVGLIAAFVMLWHRWLPRSFEDAPPRLEESEAEGQGDAEQIGTPDQWLSHPHPRREVLKECLYVAWPLAGAALGFVLANRFAVWGSPPPPFVAVSAGVAWGYLCGAALVWAVRILGTLAFGKEAMGLGDVHLLAAIGAVLGWRDAAVIFFIAPFIGLAGTALVAGLGRRASGQVRVVPYGPYLAAGAVAWMLLVTPLRSLFVILVA